MVWMYTQQLTEQIRAHSNKPMNIAKWLQFYAFDVMAGMSLRSIFIYHACSPMLTLHFQLWRSGATSNP